MSFFPDLGRTSVLAAALLIFFASSAFAVILEPTGLQDAHLLRKNTAEAHVGISWADRLRVPFQRDDKDRRVAEVPALTLDLGLGDRVEGQLSYSYLYLKENGQNAGWNSGDLTVGFKVGLLREKQGTPALALRIATKLPNANRSQDYGTDQTDFFLDLLGARRWGHVSLFANLGFAILGNPHSYADGEQDDIMRYGVGLMVPLGTETTRFLLSAEGNALCRPYTHNRRGAVRAGIQQDLGWGTLDFGGSFGYVEESEDWSMRTGVTVPFALPSFR